MRARLEIPWHLMVITCDRCNRRGFGRLDIVFANAGINGIWTPIEELQPDEWDRTLDINLKGTYLTVHFAVPHLKRVGSGSIIITKGKAISLRSPTPACSWPPIWAGMSRA
jgi:NAD(P)-dependent dehydrogenase (short-subunit alcohol dehydrogenase family)